MFRKILIAYDMSDGAKKALDVAIDLAGKYNAELWAVSVDELPYYAAAGPYAFANEDVIEESFADDLAKATKLAKSRGVELHTKILTGHAAREIVQFAEDNGFDLIVAGHVGRSAFWGILLGSTSERISHQSRCTVLIVK